MAGGACSYSLGRGPARRLIIRPLAIQFCGCVRAISLYLCIRAGRNRGFAARRGEDPVRPSHPSGGRHWLWHRNRRDCLGEQVLKGRRRRAVRVGGSAWIGIQTGIRIGVRRRRGKPRKIAERGRRDHVLEDCKTKAERRGGGAVPHFQHDRGGVRREGGRETEKSVGKQPAGHAESSKL